MFNDFIKVHVPIKVRLKGKAEMLVGPNSVKKFSIQIDWWRVVETGFIWSEYQIFGLVSIEFEFPGLGPGSNLPEVII